MSYSSEQFQKNVNHDETFSLSVIEIKKSVFELSLGVNVLYAAELEEAAIPRTYHLILYFVSNYIL